MIHEARVCMTIYNYSRGGDTVRQPLCSDQRRSYVVRAGVCRLAMAHLQLVLQLAATRRKFGYKSQNYWADAP